MVYLLLFETAARISEVRAIKFSDIDLNTNKIKIITLKQRRNRNIFEVRNDDKGIETPAGHIP